MKLTQAAAEGFMEGPLPQLFLGVEALIDMLEVCVVVSRKPARQSKLTLKLPSLSLAECKV
jgi:hypothetical protein